MKGRVTRRRKAHTERARNLAVIFLFLALRFLLHPLVSLPGHIVTNVTSPSFLPSHDIVNIDNDRKSSILMSRYIVYPSFIQE